jgi:hypothetical protein
MRSRLPLSKVRKGCPVAKATIFLHRLARVARVAEPAQIARVICATGIAGQLVVEVKAGLVWPSASRTGRVWVRAT